MSDDLHEELEELVRKWRHTLYTNEDENRTRMACADDLAEVLDRHE